MPLVMRLMLSAGNKYRAPAAPRYVLLLNMDHIPSSLFEVCLPSLLTRSPLFHCELLQFWILQYIHPVIHPVSHGVVSHGAVRNAASSYAAMRMVAGSRPVFIIA